MCQPPSKRRTDGRTDRRRESNLVHLWHLVAIILMNLLIIDQTSCIYYFFVKLKHCGLFPHRMDARDRHNGQRDKRTSVRQFDTIATVKISAIYTAWTQNTTLGVDWWMNWVKIRQTKQNSSMQTFTADAGTAAENSRLTRTTHKPIGLNRAMLRVIRSNLYHIYIKFISLY